MLHRKHFQEDTVSTKFRMRLYRIGSLIMRRTGAALRYFGVLTALLLVDSASVIAKKSKQIVVPFIGSIGAVLRKLFLGAILSLYFFIIKARKKTLSFIFAGRHKIIAFISKYVYKITIGIIILLTLSQNLFANKLNAEELRSKIIINSLISDQNDAYSTLIEEGPLRQRTTQNEVGYINGDQFANVLYTPDTDDDDLYGSDDIEGAISVPVTPPAGSQTPSAPLRDGIETYIVKDGDTISTISQRYGININTILWQNSLSWNSTIRPGQKLELLPVNGVTHKVKSGETVAQIAKKYQADAQQIMSLNKIADSSDLNAGETLIIPDGIKPTAVAASPRQRTITTVIRDVFDPQAPEAQDSGTRLLWPLSSHRITQYFNWRHSGLDVGDKIGQPVYAAESGKIERAGWNRGYGNNIVINHGNGIKTLYGHSSKLLVQAGETVTRGQLIMLIGSTGWSTGPHLHFEVIVNGHKVNPLGYVR